MQTSPHEVLMLQLCKRTTCLGFMDMAESIGLRLNTWNHHSLRQKVAFQLLPRVVETTARKTALRRNPLISKGKFTTGFTLVSMRS
mmetsp:Transcript_13043/g.24167  ORF Transcript_13043/g.24167 Transcript_13043/m.24167 type:complete len:86 (-) Transcript_13043:490-747(-)